MAAVALGRYEVIREIARSNDVVYEAFDPLMQRRVAVKQLHVPHDASTEERDARRQRFLREARVTASLDHPNVVRVYDVGEANGAPYLVMELIEAETLSQTIRRRGYLPDDEARQVADQLLSALSYAHSRGVLHRDVKSQNVFISGGGLLKLADFGIASLATERTLSRTGTLIGTLPYMSPEHLNGHTPDVSFDLWASGVLLVETLSGSTPFGGSSVNEILSNIGRAAPTWAPAVPSRWRPVLERALSADKSRRFATAEDFREAIERLTQSHAPTKATSPSHPVKAGSLQPIVLPPAVPSKAQVPSNPSSSNRTPQPVATTPPSNKATAPGRSVALWGAGVLAILVLFRPWALESQAPEETPAEVSWTAPPAPTEIQEAETATRGAPDQVREEPPDVKAEPTPQSDVTRVQPSATSRAEPTQGKTADRPLRARTAEEITPQAVEPSRTGPEPRQVKPRERSVIRPQQRNPDDVPPPTMGGEPPQPSRDTPPNPRSGGSPSPPSRTTKSDPDEIPPPKIGP